MFKRCVDTHAYRWQASSHRVRRHPIRRSKIFHPRFFIAHLAFVLTRLFGAING